MTDIDFEELDKAVNSVINDSYGDTSAPKDIQPEPIEQKENQESEEIKESETKKIVERPLPQLSSPRRFKGRFMDVVHPSSDMRSNTPRTVSVEKAKEEEEEIKPSPEYNEPKKNDFGNMPDPIDVHEQKNQEEEKIEDKSVESPFIADAKVEKRPLGAFSQSNFETTEPKDQVNKVEEKTENLIKDESLPAELQKDVLSIEGDSTTQASSVNQSVTPVVSFNQHVKNTNNDKIPAPVYDTKEYHGALMHAPKKKSGWLTVVWIVLVIALGALAGFSVYWFILK